MVNTEEMDQMKELGIKKRRVEGEKEEFEYVFKLKCKVCGENVEWCNCAKTLEDAKKVLVAQTTFLCWDCACKEENCSDEMNKDIAEVLEGYPGTSRSEAYMELISEGYDGDCSHVTEDGVEYYDCECAT